MDKYDMVMDTNPEGVIGKFIRKIRKNSTVLEFGCAFGRMTKYMKEELDCDVFIVEIDEKAYARAIQFAEGGYCGDIEAYEWFEQFKDKRFDYILFADVLEHLRNPLKALEMAKELLISGGEIIISIPNIGHFDILANLYLNRFTYTRVGLLDDTHIHFWGKEDLERTAAEAGCQIVEIDGVYVAPYDTEQAVEKQKLPANVDKALRSKELYDIYQFFVVLKRREDVEAQDAKNVDKLIYHNTRDENASVYFDIGKGYSEDNCRSFPVERKRGTDLILYRIDDIPQGCSKVRFTPMIGAFILASNVSIVGNTGVYEGKPLNGALIRDVFVFADTDPQIEIEIKPGTRWLEISAMIETPDSKRWIALMTELQNTSKLLQSIDELKETVTQCEMEIAGRDEEIRVRDEAIQSRDEEIQSRDETICSHERTIERLDDEIDSLSEAIQARDARNEEVLQHCENIEKAFKKQKSRVLEELCGAGVGNVSMYPQKVKISRLAITKDDKGPFDEEEINQLFELIVQTLNAQKGVASDLQKMTAHAEYVQNLNQQYINQLNEITGSRCWRMTKPVRVALDKFKTSAKTQRIYKGLVYLKRSGVRATWAKTRQYIASKNVKPIAMPPKMESFSALRHHLEAIKKKDDVKIYRPELLTEYDKCDGKKVLLVTHEMTLTGAPIATYYCAKVLKDHGYCPLLLSLKDGKLAETIAADDIPSIVAPAALMNNFVTPFAHLFSMIVLNTIVTAPVIGQIDGVDIPVIWWIHEAKISYFVEQVAALPEYLPRNVHVFAGGEYAARLLKEVRPDYEVQSMLYYAPDRTINADEYTFELPEKAENKFVFCCIAMLEERKGQGVLVEAIRQLPNNILNKCYFVFVGRQYYAPYYDQIQDLVKRYPQNVQYIEEIDVKQITGLYKRMDSLICCSLDDPMPIVVTEALQFKKLVICSENTGSAALLRAEKSGYVYEQNDPDQLAKYIICAVSNPEQSKAMQAAARETYEKYFSKDAFEKNMLSVINRLMEQEKEDTWSMLPDKSDLMRYFANDFERRSIREDRIFNEDILLGYDKEQEKRKVLLIADGFDASPETAALQHLIELLKKSDVLPVVVSAREGEIIESFSQKEIPVIIYKNLFADDFLEYNAARFDLIVLNGAETCPALNHLKNIDVNVVWWIHDSERLHHSEESDEVLPKELPDNVTVYCGSESVQKRLMDCYPQYQAGILHVAEPDMAQAEDEEKRAENDADVMAMLDKHAKVRNEDMINCTVSVVIPAYNAGEQFDKLLTSLRSQKLIRSIEIVVVDSGSKDNTVKICKAHHVKLIKIPNEEFSHSRARNMGAAAASGDLLLVMTQDAMPVDDMWMYHLAEIIVSGQAVAVSCLERCPEGTELYYRAASWYHAKFQGALEHSRINRMDYKDTAEELRAKASLNDVTCMIRADIFSNMLYRFNYGEDLDMGLRLLRAGYPIGVINTTFTVHGHNRKAGYYLKRGFAEARAMGLINKQWKQPAAAPKSAARQIVYGDMLLGAAICMTRSENADRVPLITFMQSVQRNMEKAIKLGENAAQFVNESKDDLLSWCVNTLRPWSEEKDAMQDRYVYDIAYYAEHVLHAYLKEQKLMILGKVEQEEILGCLEKQFCMYVGNMLAGIEESTDMYQQIKQIGHGV